MSYYRSECRVYLTSGTWDDRLHGQESMELYKKQSERLFRTRLSPSQWETALLCDDVSHWLDANLKATLILYVVITECYVTENIKNGPPFNIPTLLAYNIPTTKLAFPEHLISGQTLKSATKLALNLDSFNDSVPTLKPFNLAQLTSYDELLVTTPCHICYLFELYRD